MNNRKVRKAIKWCLFIMYIAAFMYIMFFSEDMGRTYTSRTYRYNLVLFKEIKRFLNNYQQLGVMTVFLNVAGNAIAFMPFGFCIPLLTQHRRKFFTVLPASFALSLTIETIQLIFKIGCFDVDDLFLNTIGGVLGYIVFLAYNKWFGKYRVYRRNKKRNNKNEVI